MVDIWLRFDKAYSDHANQPTEYWFSHITNGRYATVRVSLLHDQGYPMTRDVAPSEHMDFAVNVIHFAESLDLVLDGIFDFCFYLEGVRDAELLG